MHFREVQVGALYINDYHLVNIGFLCLFSNVLFPLNFCSGGTLNTNRVCYKNGVIRGIKG